MPLPDLSHFPTEFRLLCLTCGSLANDDALAETIAAEPDWDLVIRGARHHRITPALLNALRAQSIPLEIIEKLHSRTKKGTHACLRQAAELIRVSQAFAAAGVRMMALKGVALSQQLYSSIAARSPGDMDILVDPKDFWVADKVLTSLGYDTVPPRIKAAYGHLAKDLAYHGPGGMVELHQRLSRNPLLFPQDFNDLWSERDTVMIHDVSVSTLGRRFLPLYLCAHGASHSWERLRWLVDLRDVLAFPDAQAAALADSQQAPLRPLMKEALFLAQGWLGLSVGISPNDKDLASLRRFNRNYRPGSTDCLRSGIGNDQRWKIQNLLTPYRHQSNWRFLTRQIWEDMICPEDFPALPLPPSLYWLYPPLRPVGWLIRHSKSALF